MKKMTVCLSIAVVAYGSAAGGIHARADAAPASDQLRVYELNKRVADFPDQEDLSTPEAAYAVINRVMARGQQGAWRRISARKNRHRVPPADAKRVEVKPEVAEMWLNALIREVRIFRGRHAAVIAEIKTASGATKYDKRSLELEDGRWLNMGEDILGTLEDARSGFAAQCAHYVDRPVRPAIEDPESYLKPFVAFLKTKAEEPKPLVMKILAKHKVVIMGEIHHRPRYWAFNASLVRDPEFSKIVGVIYMELPSNDQGLIDEFLASSELDTMPVIDMLRDNLWEGWPDQPMLDFFVTVWKANQPLAADRRMRIVLADMQRPWKDIHQREDFRQYETTPRDRQMADNILRDLREHPDDQRNTLFIVGAAHAMLNFKYPEGSPVRSAGWYLREELGPAMPRSVRVGLRRSG
jgi:hypothetical protein